MPCGPGGWLCWWPVSPLALSSHPQPSSSLGSVLPRETHPLPGSQTDDLNLPILSRRHLTQFPPESARCAEDQIPALKPHRWLLLGRARGSEAFSHIGDLDQL